MNLAILIGRLTRDPEVRYTQGENSIAIAQYTLAVNRTKSKEGQPDADFIRCTAFGKSGEFAERYLKKGTKILVHGKIQTGSYTDKDGRVIYTTDVIVNNHEFVESKGTSGADNPSADEDAAAGFMAIPDIPDEELPFA